MAGVLREVDQNRNKREGSNRGTLKGTPVYVHHTADIWTEAVVRKSGDKEVVVTLPSGKEKVVDTKDVVYQGENNYSSVSELGELNPLSAASVLECLKQRYHDNQFYTGAGITLIAVNPFKDVHSLYKNAAIVKYHQQHRNRKNLPPHVYNIAQEAYSCIEKEVGKVNQSIVVSGESGAGKTVTAKHLMKYLTTVSNKSISSLAPGFKIEQRILDSNPILEAFGNATTTRNHNSSRFGKYIQLQFDRGGHIVGAYIQTYLLEKTRVVHQAEKERNFHIFYQVLQCASEEERHQWFGNAEPGVFTIASYGVEQANPENDKECWKLTREAMSDIGLTESQQEDIFKVVGAILHLGNLVFEGDEDECYVDTDIQACNTSLDQSSKLLGVEPAALEKVLTFRKITASHSRRQSVFHKPCNQDEGQSRRGCLAKLLYARLFDWLVDFINNCIKANQHYSSIGLLDIYGFEHFPSNSLEQLCINYANERLQYYFVEHFLQELQADYAKEAIVWSYTDFVNNKPCVELMHANPSIFALLNEECSLNRPSNNRALGQRILSSLSSNTHLKKPRKNLHEPSFAIQHYAGCVQYTVDGLTDKNKDNIPGELVDLLKQSSNEFISSLFENFAVDLPGKKKKTVLSKFKSSLDQLMSTLNSTNCQYIRCIKPNTSCAPGLFEDQYVLSQLEASGIIQTVEISKHGYPARLLYETFIQRFGMIMRSDSTHHPSLSSLSSESDRDVDKENELIFEPLDRLLRRQLSLHDTPKKATPKKRLRRRAGLSSADHTRKCCAAIMKIVFGHQPSLTKQFGKTKLFLKDGQLEQLESVRSKLVSRHAFTIQSAWRRYIKKKQRAVVVMQAAIRSWLVRQKLKQLHNAASKIKGYWKKAKQRALQKAQAAALAAKVAAKREAVVAQAAKATCNGFTTQSTGNSFDIKITLEDQETRENTYDISSAYKVPLTIESFHVGKGIMSIRRMPKVAIKFHTRANPVLKYAHLINQKEFTCSLADCLAE